MRAKTPTLLRVSSPKPAAPLSNARHAAATLVATTRSWRAIRDRQQNVTKSRRRQNRRARDARARDSFAPPTPTPPPTLTDRHRHVGGATSILEFRSLATRAPAAADAQSTPSSWRRSAIGQRKASAAAEAADDYDRLIGLRLLKAESSS